MTTIETGVDQATLVGLYRTAARINAFDETYRTQMMSGKFAGMYYSPRGQEFAAASVAAHLRPTDYVVTTYRGGYTTRSRKVFHCGTSGRSTWAGRPGRAAARAAPMHVTSPKHGLMVTTGVVGSGLPIANGLALAAQMRGGTDQVTVVNFGDGASNIGAFHESLNLASLWSLPVIFLCQNNKWPSTPRWPGGARRWPTSPTGRPPTRWWGG